MHTTAMSSCRTVKAKAAMVRMPKLQRAALSATAGCRTDGILNGICCKK